MRKSLILLAATSALLCASSGSTQAGEDRDDLWRVISNDCVSGQKNAGVPFPCQQVDLKRGVAVLRAADAHLLLIPTRRIEGIESPEILASEALNYWEDAWEARTDLKEVVSVAIPRDAVALAVNSAQARSQDQLHIHIGCVKPEVRAALQVYETKVGAIWSRLPFGVAGHRYRIMKIVGDTLVGSNPFKLLADGIPAARDDMASQTLVVVGARFRDGRSGFYALTNHSVSGAAASGEGLLDYKCSVLLSSH